MTKRRSDEADGGNRDPRWSLLRPEQAGAGEVAEEPAERERAGRQAMELAALEIAGKVGYQSMTVEGIIAESGSNRLRFYRSFGNKAECYTAAYSAAIDQLADYLLRSGAQAPSWTAGLGSALAEFAEFTAAEPVLAKALLAEVHVANGGAMDKRKEVFERLRRAIDRAPRETESRHSPPPITAAFILNAIEAAAVRALFEGKPGEFAASVPDLLSLAVAIYFGQEAARAAHSRATLLYLRRRR